MRGKLSDLDTIGSVGYGEKLGVYGFDKNLFAKKDDCERWFKFCKENRMIVQAGTTGTLVHRYFNDFFELNEDEIIDRILGVNLSKLRTKEDGLDHMHLFDFRPNPKIKMIVTSPYTIFNPNLFDWIGDTEYSAYMIHPKLLTYYGFVNEYLDEQHPLSYVSYAFMTQDEAWKVADVLIDALDDIINPFALVHE